uniref:GOLPH3/VPS74 family protein n=1 Tax=Paractinoplanes polyasparticus TaxID=2856853 RepID=UPI001C841104|nr:GPP34 family phosphoprotein [Actinoplanes polyasparticus]
MQSLGPARLTDDLWLAAHDGVRGRLQVNDRTLGVGLATGLLAELVHGGHLELHDGVLIRTAAPTDDLALRPVLIQMEAEEADLAAARPVAPRASPPNVFFGDWPAQPGYGLGRPPATMSGHQREAEPSGTWSPHPGPARHTRPGHDLGTWLAYLSYDRRAERLVIERLSRMGLAKREERSRWLRRPVVAYVPCDSVTAANPANKISTAVQNRRRMDWRRLDGTQLCLAGLILATGLHHHAFATLDAADRSYLTGEIRDRLDEPTRTLLRAADAAVGEAAMR